MGIMNMINDFLNPYTDEDIDSIEVIQQDKEQKIVSQASAKKRYVANGLPLEENKVDSRPQLTLHTNQSPLVNEKNKFAVKIYVPKCFDDAQIIADNLKQGKMAVVNYVDIDLQEQIRICDFLNGSIYVLQGLARRINDTMVIYVPQGIKIEPLTCKNNVPQGNIF